MIRLEYFGIAAVNRLAHGRRAGSLSGMLPAPSTLPVALALAVMLCASPADAQQVYRYKDESGQWVYTDRPPDGRAPAQTLSVAGGASSPRIVVVIPALDEEEGDQEAADAARLCAAPPFRWKLS